MCRLCSEKTEDSISHECEKHVGSSGAMEPVGVYRIFERSAQMIKMQYVQFYGDRDSKSFYAVKNVYGENSVKIFECIGHIQKLVGSRLRKLKLKQKGLGGHGKLTDSFIDKLQNYYGIDIRSNVNNIEKMQSAVIAAFFIAVPTKNNRCMADVQLDPTAGANFNELHISQKDAY
ncbi:uncharacterized protein TNCV_2586911 [Trichonephila clavipes]|nr:uncharacterized protein TNCV_2586911 [Trichonephila clavipes]